MHIFLNLKLSRDFSLLLLIIPAWSNTAIQIFIWHFWMEFFTARTDIEVIYNSGYVPAAKLLNYFRNSWWESISCEVSALIGVNYPLEIFSSFILKIKFLLKSKVHKERTNYENRNIQVVLKQTYMWKFTMIQVSSMGIPEASSYKLSKWFHNLPHLWLFPDFQ